MKNRKLIRILAITLAILLAGGVVFSALFSALAEKATEVGSDKRNRYVISMEYMPDGQALHITQRLIYTNPSAHHLEAVVFYAAGNMFRRESALMYAPDDLETVFYAGYAPAGIDLRDVRFDGEPTEFGFRGEDELFLRVACDLDEGESSAFEFDYYLLLMNCGAFQGVGDTDVRLSAFCFIPGVYDAIDGGFVLNRPLAHTRWLYADAADYDVTLALPEGYMPAGTGEITRLGANGGAVEWHIAARNVREFAVSFGRRWRAYEAETASGVYVRLLTNARGSARRVLAVTVAAIEQCEAWFGAFPTERLDVVQSDYPLGALNFPGAIWLSSDMLSARNAGEMAHALRFCLAQQYFGMSAYVEPSADAWLSDSVSEYVSYLLLEAAEGHEAFLSAVNRDWVSALQQTVPGGLRVTSDAALFDARDYDIVVLKRGAVVLHELREAMGPDGLIEGLKNFVEMGHMGETLTEMDFVAAMDAATGGAWEDFLTDWVFNVGDYANQTIDWFE